MSCRVSFTESQAHRHTVNTLCTPEHFLKTSRLDCFAKQAYFAHSYLCVLFFNSIIAGFDLEYAILEGIVLSFLPNFLPFLTEDRNK